LPPVKKYTSLSMLSTNPKAKMGNWNRSARRHPD
jgi:hypothetical protein